MLNDDNNHPENWRNRTFHAAVGTVLFGVSGLAAALWTVARLMHGDVLTACVAAGGAVFTLGFALMTARAGFRPVKLRAVTESDGLILRPDPVAVALIAIACAGVIPSGLLYVIFVPKGRIDLPMSRGDQVFSPILVGLITAFAVGALLAYLIRGPGYLKLTPTGFEAAELLSTRSGLWSDVVDLKDEIPGKQAHQPIVLETKDTKPIVIQNAGGYAPSGAALYWMIRHYWLHPENRTELNNGRALERLHHQQFEPE